MLDGKMLVGTILTASAAASTWVEQANAYGQMLLTFGGLVVACLTAWYTVERIRKLREERKDDD